MVKIKLKIKLETNAKSRGYRERKKINYKV